MAEEDTTVKESNFTCPRCSEPVEPGKKFCSQCGASLGTGKGEQTQPRLCPACGEEVSTEALFCGSCGTGLRGRSAPTSQVPMVIEVPPYQAEVRAQRKGILLGVGICLGVFALIGVGMVMGRIFFDRNAPPPPDRPSINGPPLSPQPPSAVGRVVTAEGLMDIRIYGAGTGERLRSAEAFREQVEKYLLEIRGAYAKELITHSHLVGVLVLEMTIAPGGHVSSVLSHSTLMANKEFQGTVEGMVRSWRFAPVNSGEVKVYYPILLVPAEIDPQVFISLAKEILPGWYKVIATEEVPVHKSPSEEAERAGEVPPGRRVPVVSSQGGWLGILSSRGNIGYIRQEAVSSRVESGGEKSS